MFAQGSRGFFGSPRMISDAIKTTGSLLLLGSVTLAEINAALQCITVGAIATYWVIKTCRYALSKTCRYALRRRRPPRRHHSDDDTDE